MELEEWKAKLVKELRDELDIVRAQMRQQRDVRQEFLWTLDAVMSRIRAQKLSDWACGPALQSLEDIQKALILYPGAMEPWQVRDGLSRILRDAEMMYNGKVVNPYLAQYTSYIDRLLKLAKEMEGKHE